MHKIGKIHREALRLWSRNLVAWGRQNGNFCTTTATWTAQTKWGKMPRELSWLKPASARLRNYASGHNLSLILSAQSKRRALSLYILYFNFSQYEFNFNIFVINIMFIFLPLGSGAEIWWFEATAMGRPKWLAPKLVIKRPKIPKTGENHMGGP